MAELLASIGVGCRVSLGLHWRGDALDKSLLLARLQIRACRLRLLVLYGIAYLAIVCRPNWQSIVRTHPASSRRAVHHLPVVRHARVRWGLALGRGKGRGRGIVHLEMSREF